MSLRSSAKSGTIAVRSHTIQSLETRYGSQRAASVSCLDSDLFLGVPCGVIPEPAEERSYALTIGEHVILQATQLSAAGELLSRRPVLRRAHVDEISRHELQADLVVAVWHQERLKRRGDREVEATKH